jgi:hypothetical protein
MARFTSVAARQEMMTAAPTRAIVATYRSVQSTWATARPNSSPFEMMN